MSDEEINAALDALEDEHDVEEDDSGVSEDEGLVGDESDHEDQKEGEDKPPGYLTYDEWVKSGKDPKDFKGENAYKKEYERIKEIKDLKDSMKKVVEGIDDWKEQQKELNAKQLKKAIKEAEANLLEAKEEGDIDAALKAQEDLATLKEDQEKSKNTVTMNPVITRFFDKNPIIDQSSDQFDAEFYEDMQTAQHNILDTITNGNRNARLTDKQIERSLKVAMQRAKALHPEKFNNPRNKRVSAPSTSKRKKSSQSTTEKLSQIKGNINNRHDVSPAMDIYNMIKKVDPKAAEKFAEATTGE